MANEQPFPMGSLFSHMYVRPAQPTPASAAATPAAKTTEELAAEQAARNAAIAQRKAAYDAQMNNQFMGNFDFLNQPMEVSPFQLQGGQAIMGRPTYGGQPPQMGGNTMSSAFAQRGPQMQQGQQPFAGGAAAFNHITGTNLGNAIMGGGMAPMQGRPQQDLGQMYSLFQNPYLAELATLLFGNSSWLK